MWVKVQRTGDIWTESWCSDGNTFTVTGGFRQALTVARIGPLAVNYRSASAPVYSTSFWITSAAPKSELPTIGFGFIQQYTFLKYQYFLILQC